MKTVSYCASTLYYSVYFTKSVKIYLFTTSK